MIFDQDDFPATVNGRDLIKNPDVNVKSSLETDRILKKQIFPFRDHATNIIWQTAIGEGNEFTSLENDNFRRLIQTPESGGRCGPTANPTDNECFHELSSKKIKRPFLEVGFAEKNRNLLSSAAKIK
jgi:hypothetical protein